MAKIFLIFLSITFASTSYCQPKHKRKKAIKEKINYCKLPIDGIVSTSDFCCGIYQSLAFKIPSDGQ